MPKKVNTLYYAYQLKKKHFMPLSLFLKNKKKKQLKKIVITIFLGEVTSIIS